VKNLRKITLFIVIMLVACFFVLSIFGIKSRWGGTINHHFKGCDTLKWSSDFGESVDISLGYGKNITEENLKDIRYIMSKRLGRLGINDYCIHFDRPKNMIVVNIPESAAKPNFDFNSISKNLSILGNLKLTVKDEKNDFASMFMNQGSDPSKNEQVATDDSIISADITYKRDRAGMGPLKNIPSMMFKLNSETKEKFNEIKKRNSENAKKVKDSEENLKKLENEIKELEKTVNQEKEENKKKDNPEGENAEEKKNEDEKKDEEKEEPKTENEKKLEELKKQKKEKNAEIEELKKQIKPQLEIFLDKDTVYSGPLDRSFNEAGNLEVQNFKLTTSEVLNTINIVSSGKLPSNLAVLDMKKLSPALGENYKRNIIIFAAILFILALAYIFIKYKFMGVIASVCVLGHFGFLIACFTGFFSFLPGVFLNTSAAMGAFLSILSGICMFIFLASKILKKLNNSQNIELAVNRSFKENSKLIVMSNLLIIVVSLIVMSMFVAEKQDLVSNLINPITSLFSVGTQNKIFSFSYALLMGTCGCLIFQYVVPKLLFKSISGFKYFRNAKVYGGKIR